MPVPVTCMNILRLPPPQPGASLYTKIASKSQHETKSTKKINLVEVKYLQPNSSIAMSIIPA
jgi:hypothetical protein